MWELPQSQNPIIVCRREQNYVGKNRFDAKDIKDVICGNSTFSFLVLEELLRYRSRE
ncbi:hypothetical protein LEP1GSC040_3051 [Leptospira santarosai str. 2000030832]|nr:hypothetical protein LEP1GSC040_3051 [Leptospira santarosai str. 2000030832]